MSSFLFVTPTWDGQAWAREMRHVLPQHDVRIWPNAGDVSDVHYVAAWLPPVNVINALPALKVIFSLGAGVDAILSDQSLPVHTPIVRVNDPDLTMRMTEHVVLHVLMHHRQQRRLNTNQAARTWEPFAQHAASALRVGVMGLGVLGAHAAQTLARLGFQTAGWSRTAKAIAGVECFAGSDGLDAFLARTDVLVCLLPATGETDGILNRALFLKLARNGPFGAPILINAGRGRQQVEADILACLDAGELYAASLDVFNQEPLDKNSALWTDPRIFVTPHTAADSDPATICNYIAAQIDRFERTGVLENVVDRVRGY
jgi:glyoxylate/hydroxypyruvate reductase